MALFLEEKRLPKIIAAWKSMPAGMESGAPATRELRPPAEAHRNPIRACPRPIREVVTPRSSFGRRIARPVTTTRTQSSAFSLVETALAIGIVAFAFVSLIALLPLGLTHFRSAVDTSVESQIFQRVVTDAEQADFDLLTGSAKSGSGQFYVLPARFFDEQGGEIVPRSPGQPTAYEAVQII